MTVQHIDNENDLIACLKLAPAIRMLEAADIDRWVVREIVGGFRLRDNDGQLINVGKMPIVATVATSLGQAIADKNGGSILKSGLWCSSYILSGLED